MTNTFVVNSVLGGKLRNLFSVGHEKISPEEGADGRGKEYQASTADGEDEMPLSESQARSRPLTNNHIDVPMSSGVAEDMQKHVREAVAASEGEAAGGTGVSPTSANPTGNGGYGGGVNMDFDDDVSSMEDPVLGDTLMDGQLRVLIVDDSLAIQRIMRRWFEANNCVVTCADNGKNGLALIMQQKFEVMLLDFLMVSLGEGLGG